MTTPTSHALFDLESPIRDLDNLASLTMQWAQARTFYLPDELEDEVTNQLRTREVDHLQFAIAEIASKARELKDALYKAFDAAKGGAS
jgi:hypothetical protein